MGPSTMQRTILASLLLFSPAVFAGTSVDINKADAATLAQSLDGVGIARAQAIVEWREQHGPFRAADDLISVKGIGKAMVEKNREFIQVEAPSKKGSAKGG
ncbi:ComEA family DNA-binding protein [Pinirhizobacter soli]|uniref:ComEA family DNA-binding protein n=2 Tax=Pinirhizobacter soli TaxID=2786953 RepID=UPI00202A5523|nr:ComEA family DNA-binding protein [Pinirhizobacter soli]